MFIYTSLTYLTSGVAFLKLIQTYLFKISGENVSIEELTDFICAAQMAREFKEFHTDPEEQKV